mmetsp:Transcript_18638/g.40853  ORF Transcript_18638/g.40853 Transcript_18638/m.40853 type:complete len:200 (+) Transcript_18638:812-1411(+)
MESRRRVRLPQGGVVPVHRIPLGVRAEQPAPRCRELHVPLSSNNSRVADSVRRAATGIQVDDVVDDALDESRPSVDERFHLELGHKDVRVGSCGRPEGGGRATHNDHLIGFRGVIARERSAIPPSRAGDATADDHFEFGRLQHSSYLEQLQLAGAGVDVHIHSAGAAGGRDGVKLLPVLVPEVHVPNSREQVGIDRFGC